MTQVDPSFAEGSAVTLTGDQALKFTRYRDTEKDFSNNSRMERQKQYLVNFMGQAVKAMKADMGLPVSLYQSLTDDMSQISAWIVRFIWQRRRWICILLQTALFL